MFACAARRHGFASRLPAVWGSVAAFVALFVHALAGKAARVRVSMKAALMVPAKRGS